MASLNITSHWIFKNSYKFKRELKRVKYFQFVTASPEKDPQYGWDYVIVKISNPAAKEIKTAEQLYIERKKETFNENDATDMKEMKISEEIRNEIHEIWKTLNSGETSNYGVAPSGSMKRSM